MFIFLIEKTKIKLGPRMPSLLLVGQMLVLTLLKMTIVLKELENIFFLKKDGRRSFF
jgi:hypothetical protein